MVRWRSSWHPRSWDPLVVGPPAVALVVVLVMLLAVTIPAERSAPEPRSMGRDTSEWGGSSAFATARPGAPVRPAPREGILPQPSARPTFRAEARSPLLVIPASTSSGLRSIQAP